VINKMNQEFEKAVKSIKHISLKPDEKNRLLHNLIAYADQRPPIRTPYWRLIWSNTIVRHSVITVGIFALLVIVSGGSVVSAAERALPGDFLYRIKVSVTEPVRLVLAVGTSAKAKVHAEFAGRRLAEAERLAASNRLDPLRTAEIKSRFAGHVANFSALRDKIPFVEHGRGGLTSADVKLEVEVSAHSRVLGKLKKHSNQEKEIETIESAVNEYLNNYVWTSRSAASALIDESATTTDIPVGDKENKENDTFQASKSILSNSAFKKQQATAEVKMKKTEWSLKRNISKDGEIQREVLTDANTSLNTAQKELQRAKEEHANGRIDQAEESLRSGTRALEEASIIIKSGIDLGKTNKKKNK